jgi:hypothetical protein
MLKFAFAALLALATLTGSVAAYACPPSYVPCGQAAQLCCPG